MAQSAVKLSGNLENEDDGFLSWTSCMENYLVANDLWDILNVHESDADWKDSRRKNAAALYAIQSSCEPEVLSRLNGIKGAKLAWDYLVNRPKLHRLAQQQQPHDPQEVIFLKILAARVESETGVAQLPRPPPQLGGAGGDPPPLPGGAGGDPPPLPVGGGGDPPPPPQLPPPPPPQLPPPPPLEEVIIAELMFRLKKTIYDGNLAGMKAILDQHHNVILTREKTPDSGQTALHLAAEGQNLQMVKELVNRMEVADMGIMDHRGFTALEAAIARGSLDMVECIHNKNTSVVLKPHPKGGDIPLVYAVAHQASKNVVNFLYCATSKSIHVLYPENNSQGYKFLAHCVRAHMFDVALLVFRELHGHSTTAENPHKWDVLCALSQMPEVFRSGCRLVFWKRWIYASKKMRDLKMTHLRSEVFLHIFCDRMLTIDDRQWFGNNQLHEAWHLAIQFGVVEVVVEMVKKNPHILSSVDTSGQGLFFHSIRSRQENIFSLYYGLDEKLKYHSVSMTDRAGNTVLHMAAKLSPPSQLARISGAALQMQRELEWYKEVERIVTPAMRNRKNEDGMTAREVFTKTHKELVIEGEKWMKQTASSSTVVGAFIITTTFAAAFNVPGGSNKDTGLPRFLHERAFMIFMVSDAVSLFWGISSVLMFLGILSSRYSEEDFYIRLPTKMIIGLSTLFFSIASMMVAFCAALVITLDRRREAVIPIVLIAGVPLTLSYLFPLLIEIFMSTYGGGIFDKKMKPWY